MSATGATTFDLLDLKCTDRFEHNGIEVQVNTRRDIDEGVGRAAEVIATSDGGRAGRKWHSGPSAEPVYYVVATATRVYHGWIDSMSRNVVQTG